MKYITSLLMIFSGISLTIASAWFGIHGLLIFFPDKELYNGILFLGISLEIAKIFTAVFLFHYSKDTNIPKVIKTYMALGVSILILISAFATYVHLSFYVADYIRIENKSTSITSRLNTELETNRKEREQIDKQIASLPTESVRGRIALMNKFDRRKKQIDQREELILNKLNVAEDNTTQEKDKKREYSFLDYISSSFGQPRQTIYNALILLLVTVLDPLAIFLTLSGTYILTIKPTINNKEETTQIVEEITTEVQEPIIVANLDEKEKEVFEHIIQEHSDPNKNKELKLINGTYQYTE